MVRRRRGRLSRFPKRFHFALTKGQFEAIHKIADLANDDAAEVVRRMIEREIPFFLYFTSVEKRLPSIENGAPSA